jgi:hypothetical protein
MFVAHDVDLGVPFGTARPRMMDLFDSGVLADASQAAYDEGLASLVRAGPPDDLPAPARLIQVRSLRPALGADRVTAGLRWEATGASAGLFAVLDADLTLAAAGPQASRLSLAGVYRPPYGYLNGDLHPATTGRVADATVRALLRATAGYLAAAGRRAANFPRPADAPLPGVPVPYPPPSPA